MKRLIACLFLALASWSYGTTLTEQEWRANAQQVIELHQSNRDDKVFLDKYATYTLGIYAKGVEMADNGCNPQIYNRFFVMFYMNCKLLFQFALDHKDIMGESTVNRYREMASIARSVLETNHIPMDVVAPQLDAFRRPLAGYGDLRLRSL